VGRPQKEQASKTGNPIIGTSYYKGSRHKGLMYSRHQGLMYLWIKMSTNNTNWNSRFHIH